MTSRIDLLVVEQQVDKLADLGVVNGDLRLTGPSDHEI
jgi:hypothetical protein